MNTSTYVGIGTLILATICFLYFRKKEGRGAVKWSGTIAILLVGGILCWGLYGRSKDTDPKKVADAPPSPTDTNRFGDWQRSVEGSLRNINGIVTDLDQRVTDQENFLRRTGYQPRAALRDQPDQLIITPPALSTSQDPNCAVPPPNDLDPRLAAIRADNAEKMAKMQEDLRRHEKQLALHTQQLASHSKRIAKNENSVEQLKKEIADLKAAITALGQVGAAQPQPTPQQPAPQSRFGDKLDLSGNCEHLVPISNWDLTVKTGIWNKSSGTVRVSCDFVVAQGLTDSDKVMSTITLAMQTWLDKRGRSYLDNTLSQDHFLASIRKELADQLGRSKMTPNQITVAKGTYQGFLAGSQPAVVTKP